MRRTGLAALVLAILACVLAYVLVTSRGTAPDAQPPGEAAPSVEDGAGADVARRHVRLAAETPGTVTGGETAPAAPVTISRERSADPKSGGVLRIRVVDGAGRHRGDARLNVVASRAGERGSMHGGPVGPEGVTLSGLDWSRAALRVSAGHLLRTTTLKVERGMVHDVVVVVPRGVGVTGTVRHAELGALASARVTAEVGNVRPSEGDVHDALRATTDARGAYALTNVPPGTYLVYVSGGQAGPGVNPVATLEIGGTDDVTQDLVIGTPSVTGVVLDAVTHLPVAGAEITVPRPHLGTARTDADGRYELTDLLRGVHTMRVTRAGYARAEATVEVARSGAPARLDVDLQPLGVVRLLLRDPEGAPVRTLTTIARRSRAGAAGWSTMPTAEGEVPLAELEPAPYDVRVEALGFLPRELVVTGRPGQSVLDVTLEPDPDAVVLEGVVTHAVTGAPLPGAKVYDASLSEHHGDATDAEGRFALYSELQRPTAVLIELDGFGTERVEVKDDGPLEVALRPAATLVLRVRDADDDPRAGWVGIRVLKSETGATPIGGYARADRDGVAVWRRFLPGRYVLEIDADDDASAVLEIDLVAGRNVADVRTE